MTVFANLSQFISYKKYKSNRNLMILKRKYNNFKKHSLSKKVKFMPEPMRESSSMNGCSKKMITCSINFN